VDEEQAAGQDEAEDEESFMSQVSGELMRAARDGFAALEAAEARILDAEHQRVFALTATGSGDIAQTFSLGRSFRLVYVRCHFVGGAGTAAMHLGVDHRDGAAYDARLDSIASAGTGSDVNYRVDGSANALPSPWSFQQGDALSVAWINPDTGNMTWGLEVGLAFIRQPRLPVAGAS